jgi:biofilm PGA synthesis lipoprotein PgaB
MTEERIPHPRSLRTLLPLALLDPALALAGGRGEFTVLSYHEIADPADALTPSYAVSPTNFLRQMDWLRNHGYHFIRIDDILASRAGKQPLPPKAVLVTFDDAYQSVYVHAWPVLKMFRIPAVVSVVGSWLDEKETVDFDGKREPRRYFITWEALSEMARTGLVEVGSHSWDLHRGILANPQGNVEPSATNRRWLPEKGRHEDEASYRARIEADLARSVADIRRHTGKSPRMITWPYGRFNATTVAVAERLGFKLGLTLLDGENGPDTPLMELRRLIVDREMTLPTFAQELGERERNVSDQDRPQSIAHVDLDAIYDPDPAQQERNLSHLLDRLQWLNVNTVYLQAFADPDGNGSADAVYFPSRRMPMRADLFNRVAWQIRTRTQVKRLYAWFPALAFELPPGDPAAKDVVTALPLQPGETLGRVDMGYKRLSPFSPRAREALREIYEDLARSANFDGLLFHDDLTLSDREDASPPALATYRSWGLPGSVEEIRKSDDRMGRWTIFKINALDDLALELADVVRKEQPGLVVGRNLYAQVVLKPRAEAWYSQALDNSIARYDFTAIMAMPYMESASDPGAFYRDLVAEVKARGALRKVIFELQAVDWRHDSRPIPTEQLGETIRMLWDLGALHVGYYPDSPFKNHPDPAVMRRVFSQKPAPPRPAP